MNHRFVIYSKRQILTLLMRTGIISIYGALAFASAWILKDYSPAYIIDRILPFALPPLLSLLSAAFLSIFVLSLEQTRLETLLFSLICLAFAGLNLDIFLLGIITDPELALQISRIDHFFLVLVTMGANIHLVYLVTGKKDHWWLVYLAYGIGAAVACFTPTDYYFQGVYHYFWGFFARKNFLYDAMSMTWLLAIFYSIYVLGLAYRQTSDRRRRETIKYLIYGFLTTAALSLTNTPAIHGYEVYPLGTFIFISLFLLAYGLYKHNIRIALEQLRSLIFRIGHLTLSIAAGFSPWLLLPGSSQGTKMFAGVMIVTITYTPLQKIWDKVLNLLIKRSAERLQQEYYRLTYNLSRFHHLHAIYREMKEWLFRVLMNSRYAMVFYNEKSGRFEGWRTWNTEYQAGFFPSHAGIKEGDEPLTIRTEHPLIQKIEAEQTSIVSNGLIKQWMADRGEPANPSDWLQEAGMVVPVFSDNRIICLLIAGNKINDRSYIPAEIEILKNIGAILGPFIENAKFFERLEYLVERRTRALNHALADAKTKSRKIESINQTIKQQNHIFLSLFETSSKIHNIHELNKLFDFTLKNLKSVFPHLGFGIIVAGGRSEIIESGAFQGITSLEQKSILKYRAFLENPKIDRLLKKEMSQHVPPASNSRELRWQTIPMRGRNSRIIGHMVIKGPELDQTTQKVIGIFLAQVSAVAQYKLLMRQLETVANTDGLTGVANRTFFEKEYADHLKNAEKFPEIYFSLIMIDLNGLKQINDRYGHEKGDEGIKMVAEMLRSVCRETDILARIGGDEFALLLPACNSQQAHALLKRLRDEEKCLFLAVREPQNRSGQVPIRISIGLAGSDEAEPEKIMKMADQRMYRDKEKYYQSKNQPCPSK